MIELIPEWQLSAPDEAEIVRVIGRSFPTDFGGRSFYQQRPHARIVWREEKIVGHLAVFYRAIRLNGGLSDVIGLGDFACLPSHRGQGIGLALMEHALSLGRESRAEFALLFGKRDLYDRAGFEPVGNAYVCVDMTGARTGERVEREANFLMVRPLDHRVWPRDARVDFLGPLF